jgi:hypothetical protein
MQTVNLTPMPEATHQVVRIQETDDNDKNAESHPTLVSANK